LPSFDILVSNNKECVDTPIPNVYIQSIYIDRRDKFNENCQDF
jgi:hypothetical protein